MGIADMKKKRINAARRFSLQSQDSPSSSSSTAEFSLPEKIESSFLTANALNRRYSTTSSCVEMVSLSFSYTSLKDLLPPFPSGISSASPSWDEIPIKNRLVKKAATFYLQPMSSREPHEPGFFELLRVACSFHCRTKSECVHGCGCLEFVNQMIGEVFQRFFGANRSRQSVELGSSPRHREREANAVGDSIFPFDH
ncbi:hypothetical protein NE237_017463 [Protea cynaroides]|uniref:Uncharacterized protein n=1 Tax=Protea cynaroides TaxID=273540 RepID=A0A9Q0K823_9MAGN|nr:hypothetical protein NE237_017463 [Protea cynaroides]